MTIHFGWSYHSTFKTEGKYVLFIDVITGQQITWISSLKEQIHIARSYQSLSEYHEWHYHSISSYSTKMGMTLNCWPALSSWTEHKPSLRKPFWITICCMIRQQLVSIITGHRDSKIKTITPRQHLHSTSDADEIIQMRRRLMWNLQSKYCYIKKISFFFGGWGHTKASLDSSPPSMS